MQPPPRPTLFAGKIGQYTQQQQTIPGVRISVNELRPTTRFNDLHEELQKVIESVDNFILRQIGFQQQCQGANKAIDDISQQMPPDVEYCTKSLETMQQALENDADSIAFAKRLVTADAADAKLSFRVIQNLKLPQQFHQSGLWSTANSSQTLGPAISDEDPELGVTRNLVDYFSKQADEMASSLDTYKNNTAKVEAYLRSIEANTMHQIQQVMLSRGHDGAEKSAEDQVRELAAVLREFENGIVGVATKLGEAREKVQEAITNPTETSARSWRYGAL